MIFYSMIIIFLGGLGLFLYGMNRLAEGMQKLTGEKLKNFLGALSDNKAMAIAVGALITAIIQSSTGTTIMVVGFVNAGIMSLVQSVGVIMGANVGTTVTGWMVSIMQWADGGMISPKLIAFLFSGLGAFLLVTVRTEKKKTFAEVLFGIGIFFMGLYTMSDAIVASKDSVILHEIWNGLASYPVLTILVGVVITFLLKSSSISIGILQCFALNGMVQWEAAVFLIIGMNIGTCLGALTASAGTHSNAKRSAFIHLFFNIFGGIIFGVVFGIWMGKNQLMAQSNISCLQIAIFHSVFNILCAVLLAPFTEKIAHVLSVVIKDKGSDEVNDDFTIALRHLDKRILESPTIAVAEVTQEVVHMGEVAYETAKLAFDVVITRDEKKAVLVFEKEEMLDKMTGVISEYLVKISASSLTQEQHTTITNLFYTVSNFERMGDHSENIAELGKYMMDNEIWFSEPAYKELEGIMEIVTNSFVYSIRARRDLSEESAKRAKDYENLVDRIEDELRRKHMKRLANGLCKPTAGVVFLDILSNLERISDHADNVAGYVLNEI